MICREKSGVDFTRATTGKGYIDSNEELIEKLDLLTEKRHSIREAALTSINNTLALRACGYSIEARQEQLADALQPIIQRADEKDALLALRCTSLAAISMEEGTLFKNKMEGTLTKLVKEGQPVAPTVRAAAIEALAFVSFMNSTDPEHVLEVVDTISQIFYEDNDTSAGVFTAAIDGWALLLTTVEDDVLEQTIFPENIQQLSEFLSNSDSEVRVAAGNAIALLVEALRNTQKDSQGEFEQVDLTSIESPVPWETLLAKLDDLTMEKTKGLSKTEGKKQKKAFRELVASIQDGQVPHESLQVRDVKLELSSWAQIIQLSRIRNYLGEGFIQHMIRNTNMHNIFDYTVSIEPIEHVVSSQLQKKERRRSIVEAEKVYTRYMEANRRSRERDLSGFSSE